MDIYGLNILIFLFYLLFDQVRNLDIYNTY
jgi:hypothetical protein